MDERTSACRTLTDECAALCLYLVGHAPSVYIVTKYCEAHDKSSAEENMPCDRFDRFVLAFARMNTICTKLADIYTRWFYKRSVLRRKLLLLLAILECSPSTYSYFEAGETYSRAHFWISMLAKGIGFSLYFTVSAVSFSVVRSLFNCIPENRSIQQVSER